MPIPTYFLLCGYLGLAFAMCARDRVRADGPFAWPAFPLVASFVGLILTPVTLYLFLAHPAWTWMYLFDPSSIPGLAIVPIVFAHGGLLLVSWYTGVRLLKVGRERALWYGLAGSAAATVLALVLGWHRLGRYGSYGEYHEGRALPLMEVKLGYVLIGLVVGMGAAAGYIALELARDARRVRTR